LIPNRRLRGFYEKKGMTRAASEEMKIRLDGKTEDLGVFL